MTCIELSDKDFCGLAECAGSKAFWLYSEKHIFSNLFFCFSLAVETFF
jgi:hypothetical protein